MKVHMLRPNVIKISVD